MSRDEIERNQAVFDAADEFIRDHYRKRFGLELEYLSIELDEKGDRYLVTFTSPSFHCEGFFYIKTETLTMMGSSLFPTVKI